MEINQAIFAEAIDWGEKWPSNGQQPFYYHQRFEPGYSPVATSFLRVTLLEIRCDQRLCLLWMMDQVIASNITKKSTLWIRIFFRLQVFGVSCHSVDYAKYLKKGNGAKHGSRTCQAGVGSRSSSSSFYTSWRFLWLLCRNKPFGVIHGAEHTIATTDQVPVTSRPDRMSWQEHGSLKEELDQLLKLELIRPSDGKWSSPILFVSKKDGSLHFCVNFRTLNSKTFRDTYPLPHMERKSLLSKDK